MKEIDFDELDRAVSSLMDTVPKSEPVKDDGNIKTVSLDSSEDDTVAMPSNASLSQAVPVSIKVEESTESEPEPEPEPAIEPEALSAAPAASRTSATVSPAARRGRFMDVMRSPSREVKRPVPSMGVSRHGTTLQPVTSSRTAAVDSPFRSLMNQSSSLENKPEDEVASQSFGVMEDTSMVGGDPLESPVMQVSEDIVPSSNDQQPPAASPFLPDARVEKRPLGRSFGSGPGLRPTTDVIADTETPSASTNDHESITFGKDAQLPEQPLPAELDSRLLSIETSTEEAPAAARAPQPPVVATPSVSSPSSTPVSAPEPSSQPKTHEPAGGAIYDPSAYHQPLAHPAKKKRDWLLLASIAIIVLLGIAGGVAVYYFKLI